MRLGQELVQPVEDTGAGSGARPTATERERARSRSHSRSVFETFGTWDPDDDDWSNDGSEGSERHRSGADGMRIRRTHDNANANANASASASANARAGGAVPEPGLERRPSFGFDWDALEDDGEVAHGELPLPLKVLEGALWVLGLRSLSGPGGWYRAWAWAMRGLVALAWGGSALAVAVLWQGDQIATSTALFVSSINSSIVCSYAAAYWFFKRGALDRVCRSLKDEKRTIGKGLGLALVLYFVGIGVFVAYALFALKPTTFDTLHNTSKRMYGREAAKWLRVVWGMQLFLLDPLEVFIASTLFVTLLVHAVLVEQLVHALSQNVPLDPPDVNERARLCCTYIQTAQRTINQHCRAASKLLVVLVAWATVLLFLVVGDIMFCARKSNCKPFSLNTSDVYNVFWSVFFVAFTSLPTLFYSEVTERFKSLVRSQCLSFTVRHPSDLQSIRNVYWLGMHTLPAYTIGGSFSITRARAVFFFLIVGSSVLLHHLADVFFTKLSEK